MSGGHAQYTTLRWMYKKSEYRRFRAANRQNRWADFLGFNPAGTAILGWWDGSDEVQEFAPDDIQWTNYVTYV